jgi:hypothetical protein
MIADAALLVKGLLDALGKTRSCFDKLPWFGLQRTICRRRQTNRSDVRSSQSVGRCGPWLIPAETRSSGYRGVINPPSLSCSPAALREKRVEYASGYLRPEPVL